MGTVLDFNRNREQIIHDLTDFAECLIVENGQLRTRDEFRDGVLASVLSHNESLIDRLDYWRGKALKASLISLGIGLIVGTGLLAHATLDAWQIADRALTAVGL